MYILEAALHRGLSPFEVRHPGHFSQEPVAPRFHMHQERILREEAATSKKDAS